MPLSSHRKRILTALAVAALPVFAIACGGWVMTAMIALFALAALWELFALAQDRPMPGILKFMGLATAALMITGAHIGTRWSIAALGAGFWAIALHFLVQFSNDQENTSLTDHLLCLSGIMYVPMFMQCFVWFMPVESVMVLLATAASDTGAFYAGSNIGGPKIWPSVSPKKTWAGSMGGLCLCLVTVIVIGLFFGQSPWWTWVLLGITMNIAAQMGDFFESALKRKIGVKDSGRILPGHGGLLDRIDGLLFVLPVYLAAKTLHPFF